MWADFFPEISKYTKTTDPRVFTTPWKKDTKIIRAQGKRGPVKIKTKSYFCCTLEGQCYGVEIEKGWAQETKKEEREALARVIQAADYYETHSAWPS